MKSAWIAVFAATITAAAIADEVILNNGDRLTGEVKTIDADKLRIATKLAGEIELKLSDIRTFSTDKPVKLKLKDGTVINQPITQSADGTISTGGHYPDTGKSIPITSIKKANTAPVKWKGALTAGAVISRGNTHTDSVNAGFDALRRAETDRITLNGAYNYSKETPDGESARVTSENWNAAAKYDYFLAEKWYLYANNKVERDHIANLDIRVTPGAGAGYQWWETPNTNFNTEAGATWVYESYTDPDTTNQHMAGRFAYHYDRKLNGSVSLINNFEILPSVEEFGEYLLNVDIGLRAKLTSSFFGEVKLVVQQNTQPAVGKDQWDNRYIVNIGWNF